MLQHPSVEDVFRALADPTRLAIVEHLAHGPASIKHLASPFAMSLPAVMQHIQVLEGSGLIATQKVGRVRSCRLRPGGLEDVVGWLDRHRAGWERRFDQLGTFLADEGHPDDPEPER